MKLQTSNSKLQGNSKLQASTASKICRLEYPEHHPFGLPLRDGANDEKNGRHPFDLYLSQVQVNASQRNRTVAGKAWTLWGLGLEIFLKFEVWNLKFFKYG